MLKLSINDQKAKANTQVLLHIRSTHTFAHIYQPMATPVQTFIFTHQKHRISR